MLKFTTLFSGSSGNCSFITDGRTRILIDAGVSCKRISEALRALGEDAAAVDALLITHEHIDHVKGVDVLCRKYGIPLYANEYTLHDMALSPKAAESARIIRKNAPFAVGDIEIAPFSTPHDAADPLGFVFRDEKTRKRLGFASDLGHVSVEVSSALSGCDALYIESNHDVGMLLTGRYPDYLKRRVAGRNGHLSNDDCAAFLAHSVQMGTTQAMLGHLSRENNLPRLAYDTGINVLRESGINAGEDVRLYVAPASYKSEAITV
ncbi:MAG: MBL fold metallo-hydrolase [Clostridia bacterium]|nr:MBL fold metallo-hydrolase [Clostridia bacterium]